MTILSLPQKKGGVGKTTLLRVLADYFSASRRVLLVDMDDQCSLSSILMPMERLGEGRHKRPPVHENYNANDPAMSDWSGRSSSADIFFSGREVHQYGVAEYAKGSLDILPGDSRELVAIREHPDASVRERIEKVIVEFFAAPEVEAEYDLIMFDTGPNESALMRGVIQASSHVIIPVELEQQCIDGLSAMTGMILEEQGRRPHSRPLNIVGVQVNKFRKNLGLHVGFLEEVRATAGVSEYLSPVLLPNRVAYAARDVRGVLPRSIFDLPPSDPARRVALEFCQYVEQQLFGVRHAA